MSKIDDAVDAWHEMPEDGTSLADFLGLTWEQYSIWAQMGVLPKDSPYYEEKGE